MLGLSGFMILDSVKRSISALVESNTKNYLGADFSASVRRQFTDEEIRKIAATVQPQQTLRGWDFMSMVVAPSGESRLVQVRAISKEFPFYGHLGLGSGRKVSGKDPKEIFESSFVWVYPELLSFLNVKIGDPLKIWDREFIIKDTVVDDPSQTMRFTGLAPKVFLSFDQIQLLGIKSYGATLTDNLYFKLSEKVDEKELLKRLSRVVPDPAVRFSFPKDANQEVLRVVNYLSDYLSLVSMTAVFLSSIGCAFLIRYFLSRKVKTFAIYRALGVQARTGVLNYVAQVILMGVVATGGSFLIAKLLTPQINLWLAPFAPKEFVFNLSLEGMLVGMSVATLLSVFMSFPFLSSLADTKPAQLFSGSEILKIQLNVRRLLLWTPFVLLFLGLCFYQTRSFKITTVYVLLMTLAAGLIALLGFLVLLWDPGFKNWIFRFGSLSFRRKKFLSLSIISILGLSACLMNLLPQIKYNLYNDFASPNQKTLPNLFVFDIQDEQVDSFQKLLLRESAQVSHMSAMVRGKIISVNEKAFERSLQVDQAVTREQEEDLRFRNRGVNLSYRERLADSELIIEGSSEWGEYSAERQEIPWISVEYWYAERLGLKLGDVLEFDVQGVRLKGQIHNFRKVKWNSFQPNFFVLFQPGVLESAPKMFLASIYGLNPEKSVQVQNQISKNFGNISVIDVSKLIERILALADRMTWSVQTLSLLTLLVGIVIMYSLIQFQLLIKAWDFNLLKILGFSPTQLRSYVLVEYLGPVALSLFAGSVMSLLLAGVLMKYVFNSSFAIDWLSLLLVNLGLLFICTILILLSTHKVLDRKPSFT